MDPHRSSTQDVSQHMISLFEGLLTKDVTYSKVVPGIASEYKATKGGKLLTFKLRPNLKWSNGDALTAEHIRNSFIRAMDPTTACPYPEYFTDYIAGAKEYIAGKTAEERKGLESKIGIRIVNPSTIEMTLINGSPLFLELMTSKSFMPVHPSMMSIDAEGWTNPKKYISNGPFKLADWKVNDRITAEKNENYWDAKNVKLNRLVAFPVNDQQVVYNMFNSGQIDWTGNNTIAPALVPGLRAKKEFSYVTSHGTYFYLYNLKQPPLNQVEVRKALSLVINRAEITDKILKDGKLPTYRIVPPTVKNFTSLYSDLKPMDKRIDEAKALLAKAGYPDGKGFPKTILKYNTSESHKSIAQAVKSMWKRALNIDVELENTEWKVYTKQLDNHQFQVARQGWVTDIPDPTEFLSIFRTGVPNNYGEYSNAEFDKIFNQALTESNAKKRMELFAKAEKIVLDDAGAIPLYHYVYYGLVNPKVENLTTNPAGLYLFKFVAKK